MSLLPPRWVDSGYFRVHLYVTLGLQALAAAVALTSNGQLPLWPAVAGTVLCYVGAVLWLYEQRRAGRVLLVLVALVSLVGSWVSAPATASEPGLLVSALLVATPAASGLLVGSALAAMFLGHWYLNHPGMKLEPLRRLVLWIAAAVGLRTLVAGVGLAVLVAQAGWPTGLPAALLAMHWLGGIGATLAVDYMAWETLKIPNTQSATGLLYVAVITTFLGELASQLLSVDAPSPL